MNSVSKLGLAVACSLAFASVGMAQTVPAASQKQAQAVVKVRKALFDVQNFAFGPLAAMLKQQMPFNAKAAVTAAQRIEMTSSMIPEMFKYDTRKFKVKSRARPAIWKNFSSFQQDAQNLHDAAVKLVAAAKTGDKGNTMKASVQVGKACGKCHDDFRLKE